MIAYVVNPFDSTVRQIELTSWRELGAAIHSECLTTAMRWRTGDVLYVDDEGFYVKDQGFFRLDDRQEQPFAGYAIMVGPELPDPAESCEPPRMTLEELRGRVTFISRDEAKAMVRGRPAATVTVIGSGLTEVASWWDDILRETDQ